MQGNPICRQVPWGRDPALLRAWEEGRTGYPWIDACMTQLRTEGWLHHLARHAVACFLTRGDLWQSWEEGAAVFDKYLVDADWSINSSGGCDSAAAASSIGSSAATPPWRFPRSTMPMVPLCACARAAQNAGEAIYEPWKAPQMCSIGRDVLSALTTRAPLSTTDVSKRNMARMKAYDEHKRKAAAPERAQGECCRHKRAKQAWCITERKRRG